MTFFLTYWNSSQMALPLFIPVSYKTQKPKRENKNYFSLTERQDYREISVAKFDTEILNQMSLISNWLAFQKRCCLVAKFTWVLNPP